MDIATMTEFFKCCSIINISILTLSSLVIMTTDLGYSVHTKLGIWEGSKEAHKQLGYSILGHYKILVIIFNAVPYFVLYCCV